MKKIIIPSVFVVFIIGFSYIAYAQVQSHPASEITGLTTVPSGAVMFFDLASCPTDWTEVTDARGRYLVGLPSGGSLNATVGTALTDQENRATGNHTHGVTDPGHIHDYTRVADLAAENSGAGAYAVSLGTFQTESAFANVTINATDTPEGTNAPYIQFLVCRKD